MEVLEAMPPDAAHVAYSQLEQFKQMIFSLISEVKFIL
jgi:hypothetical protein